MWFNGWYGTMQVLNTESGECLVTIKEYFEAIQNLKLISNERFITCSNDKTIKLFDLNAFECIRTFIGHKRSVKGIGKISDHQIVSCSDDKTIRIWDLNTGECLKILRGHEDGVTCVTVISDKKIISGSNYEMKIWNVETANTGCIFSIIILSNERIISANEDS
jgi:WD40 repeat protein